ncbi:hypothetical protein ElyMa_000048900 [Elysia marginata]|uniref:Uncharacterized protein n=1 Tax=Elysia marginata TaxID=1093978 RepID=A0AAV4EDQ9_9GAST|nr:hypothetical protein ElyMa_000048900 [Elysia marginata]
MSEKGGKGAPPVPSISMATEGSSSAPLQTKHNKDKVVGKNWRRDSDTSKRKSHIPSTPLLPDQEWDVFDELTATCSDDENERSEGGQDDDLEEALVDLEEYFLQDQQLGEKLNGKIADIVNKGMLTVAHRDKVKEVVANYPPPANIPNLVTPKMNVELWEMLPNFARTRDLNSQKTVSMVMTMMTISARMMDLLYSDKTSSPTTPYTLLRLLVADQLRLGSAVYADLNQRQREAIKPINDKYKKLCKQTEHATNTHLFGDSLGETIKSMGETMKLTHTVSPHTPRSSSSRGAFKGGPKNASGRMFPPSRPMVLQRGGRQLRGHPHNPMQRKGGNRSHHKGSSQTGQQH